MLCINVFFKDINNHPFFPQIKNIPIDNEKQ